MTAELNELRQHPLSAAFPSMPEADLESLIEDIGKHGLRHPGVLFEGKLLDGWHRFLACAKAGVPFKTKEFDGEDPRAFVLSQNLHRRHLTGSQRAQAVVACSNWRPSGVTSGRAEVAAALTNEQMADAAEVSERTIRQAKRAEEAGLGDAVREGRVSVERAAEVAKLPKAKREKALKEPAKPRVIVAERKFEKLYEEVKAELVETKEKLVEVTETARELEGKLTAFETTDPDEQQKEILKLQKRIVRLEQEVERVTRARNDCQDKNNELIREVKRLRREAGK